MMLKIHMPCSVMLLIVLI
ncbi:unnamed protein product [Spirodela intermedia]|uniref:Uncharacterized protein n=2 Tax=Spirodela intermedia TaxID=51605 RepID=A0A7I8L8M4_SPIIN|nr:unnamed protein product [Spirodela intermedia]